MEQTLIIIPTYNEIENIEAIINTVFETVLDLDVLVVDDQSPDGTGKAVIDLMPDYKTHLFLESRSEKSGLGAAYVHGFRWALKRQYQYIFEMDADFSHDPKELAPMLEKLKINTDLVVGTVCKWCQCCKLANEQNFTFIFCLKICSTYYFYAHKRCNCRICWL